MPDTLISVPSAAARSSAARTRWRRRAESAWRPFSIAPVPGPLLRGGHGIGPGPLIDPLDAGGQALAGPQQVIEIASQVGQARDVGAEVVAAGAPLTELTAMFPQFRAGFWSMALACPGDRIGGSEEARPVAARGAAVGPSGDHGRCL